MVAAKYLGLRGQISIYFIYYFAAFAKISVFFLFRARSHFRPTIRAQLANMGKKVKKDEKGPAEDVVCFGVIRALKQHRVFRCVCVFFVFVFVYI